jgi:hypothetical protein
MMLRTITIPYAEQPPGHATPRINTIIGPDHAETLRNLLLTLVARGEKLKSGREVRTTPDVLKYLLEQLATADNA